MQRIISVVIEKLSLGGHGIARHEGQVLFVPFSAPGDKLNVRITLQKKNYAEAEIVEIIEPASSRVSPPCSVFGRCGGCNWQHISYEEQLRQKKLIVEEQLSKFLKIKIEIPDVVPSPQTLNYRNRIQLKRQGSSLGYYARESHNIVNIDKCWIAEPAINDEIAKIKNSPAPDALQKLQLLLNKDLKVVSELLTDSAEKDSPEISFSQVNRFQNENLLSAALALADQKSYSEILDLYAGSGNFSFPLFKSFPSSPITAVELNQKAVAMAQAEIQKQNISPKKFRFLLADVGAYLKRNTLANRGLVLIDPPRSGCDEFVIRSLAYQPFQKLIYISCNPATLGRDLERLFSTRPGSLKLGKVQAFDMFPQTDHVEVLAEIIPV